MGSKRLARLLIDELLRQFQLRILHRRLFDAEIADASRTSAAKQQLLHDQPLLQRTQHHDDIRARGSPSARARSASVVAQRRGEQGVGLRAALVRREVVRAIEVHRIDRSRAARSP